MVLGLLVVGLLRLFVFSPYIIQDEAMTPVLNGEEPHRDRVLINRLVYKLTTPKRGDVILFRREESLGAPAHDLVRRIAGLPGEIIYFREGKIYINDTPLQEPRLSSGKYAYIPGEGMKYGDDKKPVKIPEKFYFVLGDSKKGRDSRHFGFVSASSITGSIFAVYWPLPRFRVGRL